MELNHPEVKEFTPSPIRLRGPNLHHVAWLKFLLSLPNGAAIQQACKSFGMLQYMTSPRLRKKIEHRYENFLEIAQPFAEERGILLPDKVELTRQNFVEKPLCSIAPALVALAEERQYMGFFDARGFEEAEAVYRQHGGMVLCSMHHSAMGVSVAYASRNWGAPLTTIRDAQFRVFEHSEYGKGYFMGADTIFVDGRNPTSGQAALLQCARRMRKKHIVAYTPDSYNGSRSRVGNVMGREAFVKTGIAALAANAGVPLCFSSTFAKGDKLRLQLSTPFYLKSNDPEAEFAEAYLAWVENSILGSPGSIFWLRYYRELFDPRSAGARDLENPPVRPDTEFKRPHRPGEKKKSSI